MAGELATVRGRLMGGSDDALAASGALEAGDSAFDALWAACVECDPSPDDRVTKPTRGREGVAGGSGSVHIVSEPSVVALS